MGTVIKSFSVSKCDYYYPVYLFTCLALKEKALGSLSISSNHNLLICLEGSESLISSFWHLSVAFRGTAYELESEIISKGKGKMDSLGRNNASILFTVMFKWEYLVSLVVYKITLLTVLDTVGNTYLFMVDEKNDLCIEQLLHCFNLLHSLFQKNIKETWEDLFLFWIFTGISLLASFYLVQSLGI